MYDALTQEQENAIQRFIAAYGRTWKQSLRDQWMEAQAQPVLHGLRNSHGPQWLQGYKPNNNAGGAQDL